MLVASIEAAPLRLWAQRSVSDLTSLGFPVGASPGFGQPAHDPSVGGGSAVLTAEPESCNCSFSPSGSELAFSSSPPPSISYTRRAVSWLVRQHIKICRRCGIEKLLGFGPRWPPLTLNLWCHVAAPHSSPLKKSLQADKSSFSDTYVCVFVLYQSTRGPKDDKWVLSGRRQS